MKVIGAVLCLLSFSTICLHADDALTAEQKEQFLRKAKITKVKSVNKGVTGTVRVTLTDGQLTHDASVQRINEYHAVYQTASSTLVDFKDKYSFNIAGWKVAQMLGLDDMVPPSVERAYEGNSGSFTWWVDDVLMDEVERLQKKATSPKPEDWAKEINVLHVYDQLIANTDSNATNLLIDKQWRIWMIDHTRAFRPQKTLLDVKMLTQCDRTLLSKMKELNEATLRKELSKWLSVPEIQGLLARRDLIVKFFESKGDSALWDRPSRR